MKLSARLILLLTFSVSVVMVVASLITLRQREAALREAARDEAQAHALTLKIALEEDYLTGRSLDAQRLINRLRENTGIYSVVLFDAAGEIVAISNTLAPEEFKYLNEAREVMASGKGIEIVRSLSGKDYFSMILPLQVKDRRIGAIEIVQSISFIKADIARARFGILITALLLFITILLVVTAVTRYNLARPIHELLDGAVAVGRGDLNYRVRVRSSGSELASLAREFNRMADRLSDQRREALHEAEERLALERKLRHNEQLAAVGRLAAGVAHEMGAPLQVIDGRAKQLLHHADASTETRQRNLTIIRNQAERIARIIRQLLNLSRPHKIRFRNIELAPLVEETVELIETQAEGAGVKIEIRRDSEAMIEADPELIQQVLLNICRNGIQAMPQGGRLRIECLKDAAEKNGRTFSALRISDTGVGIAPESLPNIFDPFFTTKEVGQGTGLGLPISIRIVEDHDGWIEAENGPGGGAVFTVYLPQTNRVAKPEVVEGAAA
ncbi:MAG TPA: ATP-binding protein [Blastocatellia bacterium]|nr:ATP-binding protein [Blastocatellia bacterium]